ncbi:MAG: hypothetical protein AABZ53_01985 [Planctomycetota bacterium]
MLQAPCSISSTAVGQAALALANRGPSAGRLGSMIGACVLAGAGTIATAGAQTFNFNDGIQGWRVFSIHHLGDQVSGRAPVGVLPAFDSSFGQPAPSLRIADIAGETWIGAPASALGSRPGLYGERLEFDVMYRLCDNATYASAGIESATMSLWIAEPAPALNVWLHRSYTFAPGLWRVGNVNGPQATQTQITEVLGNLQGIYIHTEWKTGADDTSVDNIAIGQEAGCSADFDGDGTVDFFDYDAFVVCFEGGACPPGKTADFDGDGTVDFFDYDAFVVAFEGGC